MGDDKARQHKKEIDPRSEIQHTAQIRDVKALIGMQNDDHERCDEA